jgi:hypothetical protein
MLVSRSKNLIKTQSKKQDGKINIQRKNTAGKGEAEKKK